MAIKTLRFVRQDDSAQLLEIYAPFVLESAVSFETVLPTLEEFGARIAGFCSEYPYIVCEETGRVLGYAYAHRWAERAAYQWNAELSVYLAPQSRGCGLGSVLYRVLFDALRLQNVLTVHASVTRGNTTSERFHEALGFRLVGVNRKGGYKHGAWHDVVRYERQIGTYDAEPAPFVPISAVDAGKLDRLLQAYSAQIPE